MIKKDISIHLQDFPDVNFIDDKKELIESMDLVRNICSTTLSLRDNKNLRVRLPLKSVTIIGKNSQKIIPFREIIAEEVNVKEVLFEEKIDHYANYKLQINFKKIGAKFGAKIKEITQAIKEDKWQRIDENRVEIAGISLFGDDFEIKLATKNIDESKYSTLALPNNDFLVMLSIELTKELEDEGISRDIIRAIQQNRKDMDLQVTDNIELQIFSTNPRIIEVVKNFEESIKIQTLATKIICRNQHLDQEKSISAGFFLNSLDDGDLEIVIHKN